MGNLQDSTTKDQMEMEIGGEAYNNQHSDLNGPHFYGQQHWSRDPYWGFYQSKEPSQWLCLIGELGWQFCLI